MTRTLFATLCCLLANFAQGAPLAQVDPSQPAYRQPEDMLLTSDGQSLLIANRGTGTLSIVDRLQQKVVAEWQVGRSLIHLTPLAGDRLLALDPVAQEAILLHRVDSQLTELARVPLPFSPVRAAASPDGTQLVVSCVWPRKLVQLRLDGDQLTAERELILPFAPREILFEPTGQTLLVADNFGGKLALVDMAEFSLQHVREFPAHNIRAMVLSLDQTKVLFAHQMLNSLAVTNTNDIHWGLVMSNDLRWIDLARVLNPADDFYGEGFMHPIGEPGKGGGDPTDIAVIDADQAIVTMGGTGQAGIGKHESYGLFRTNVGTHPTAVVVSPEKDIAYIANGFDDSISLVNLKTAKTTGKFPLGPMRELSELERGEKLFHNARLSMEGWMSCHSCHTDGHTNGMTSDNLGDNSFGAPKRILSLLGKADTAPFGWLGVSPSLAAQAHKSVEQTMHGGKLADEDAQALATYMASLPLPPPIDQLQGTHDPAAIAHGRQIFLRNNCIKCHAPPKYTTPDLYDVGMEDKERNRKFNPPSLRGIGHRDTFFHDARATSLRDVFEVHGHELQVDLTDQQLTDLILFLKSL
ncbi:cytochrome c peroxidase [Blastopirellula marina]|nr:cytochrome c peroxidase [Blastopirellula marina]